MRRPPWYYRQQRRSAASDHAIHELAAIAAGWQGRRDADLIDLCASGSPAGVPRAASAERYAELWRFNDNERTSRLAARVVYGILRCRIPERRDPAFWALPKAARSTPHQEAHAA